jgi:hypothetical protein
MKVNIYETVEVSDEQMNAIARVKDGAMAKKRRATRDEAKEFIWSVGSDWADHLVGDLEAAVAAEGEPSATDANDDLAALL